MKVYVYVIWMWIDWCQKYQPAEPEYEVCWRVSEVNESQASYYFEQADIVQYTFIFVFSLEKSHDSKYSNFATPKHNS